MDLYKLTIHELRDLIAKKEVTAKDAAFSYTRRIGALESDIKAYVTLTADATIGMAEEADKAIAEGKIGPLTGIPMA
ncbi:MAG: hypothetical protein LUO89_09960, partial [Methanothrix sp.]|nr:hypothetical protein [Methanothrix sp.]